MPPKPPSGCVAPTPPRVGAHLTTVHRLSHPEGTRVVLKAPHWETVSSGEWQRGKDHPRPSVPLPLVANHPTARHPAPRTTLRSRRTPQGRRVPCPATHQREPTQGEWQRRKDQQRPSVLLPLVANHPTARHPAPRTTLRSRRTPHEDQDPSSLLPPSPPVEWRPRPKHPGGSRPWSLGVPSPR